VYPSILTHFDRSAFRRGVARGNVAYARRPARLAPLGETIGRSLRATVEHFGEREALAVTHQGFRATYGELWHQVDQAARALIARGVARGDRVGLWAPSRHEWVMTQLAVARVGAVLVPVDPAASTRELARILAATRTGLLVMARGAGGVDSLSVLGDVRGACTALHQTIVLEDDWTAFLAEGEAIDDWRLAEREAGTRADDDAVILHPAGARSASRSIRLSHRAVLAHAATLAASLDSTEHDRTCVPVPLHHCFGLAAGVLGAITRGGCVVLPGESFGAGAVLAAVESERCTLLLGVESMFVAALEHADFARFDLTSLRSGSMGGAPFPAEIMRGARTRVHVDEPSVVCDPPASRPRPRRREPRMGMIQRYARSGLAIPELGL
jgi:fatty-acyl-CoA synthase